MIQFKAKGAQIVLWTNSGSWINSEYFWDAVE